MKKSDYRKVERPSKVEFVLDNLFAIELLIFPYILLIFRKPTWTSITGAVIISVICSAVAFVGCIYFSIQSRRSMKIDKNYQLDALPYAKDGTLGEVLDELYSEQQ